MNFITDCFQFKFTPYKKALPSQPLSARNVSSLAEKFRSKSFFSTPNLVNDLTDISVKILRSNNKMEFLQNSLRKINENLPATCYVPLLSNFHRNFMILRIAEKESRLFITAEKAPFLLCIETF